MDQQLEHDFDTDLEYSNEENEMFDNFYKRIFPTLERIEMVTDLTLQFLGIDKKLHFKNGKTVLIDEKKRREDYGDILLEEYSDYHRKRVGWIGSKKHTDYIVYAIMPSKKIYIFPFLILQQVWLNNYHDYVAMFGREFSSNRGYVTSNIPVPVDVLLNSMNIEMQDTLN